MLARSGHTQPVPMFSLRMIDKLTELYKKLDSKSESLSLECERGLVDGFAKEYGPQYAVELESSFDNECDNHAALYPIVCSFHFAWALDEP